MNHHDRLCHIVEDPILTNAQAVLGVGEFTEALDAALALLCGFVPEVDFECGLDGCTPPCVKAEVVLLGIAGEFNGVSHTGQSMATRWPKSIANPGDCLRWVRLTVEGTVHGLLRLGCWMPLTEMGETMPPFPRQVKRPWLFLPESGVRLKSRWKTQAV